MTRIGLLSDTHGLLDHRVLEHFSQVDEIWHAGDIGSIEVLQALREYKPTRAVFGNMDSGDVRYSLSEFYRFRVEDVNVLLTHIGGYPGKYNPWLLPWFHKSLATKQNPDATESAVLNDTIDLFVCGHSHILKVMYDKHYQFLTMNPGAAGKQGWQTVQTLLRFAIDGKEIKDLEVIELDRR
ncbi:MAG: metallophosphatase family protein [Paludibacteraceae bacterium]|nr:metallophosphatase family protein [Paludibacteraceae bacterium]